MTVQLLVRESIAGVAAEQYNFTVRCIESGTTAGDGCPCDCNRDLDRTCRCAQLAEPVTITVTKSPVYLQYPLTYLRSVNGRPYEEIINTGGSSGNRACEDRSAHASPTCGWVVDEKGQRVLGSQGFCCNCRRSELFREGVGVASREWKRSQRVCNIFANGVFKALFSTPGAAVCMRLNSTNWYEAFAIGLYQLVYTIDVRVVTANATQVLRLGPRNPSGTTSSRSVQAQLVGEFASFGENPSMQDRTLFIPAERQGEWSKDRPRFVARRNKDQWLIVPNSDIDLSGSSPNKPGVDFVGWANDAERCERPTGWGLRNRLADLADADREGASRGALPRYLVGRYYASQARLRGAGSARDFADSRQMELRGGELRLNIPQPTPAGSSILLSVAADDLRVVRRLGIAKIVSAKTCRFGGGACGQAIEALMGAFYAYVNITNDGSDDAEFQVSLTNCSAGLLPPVAKSIVLPFETSAVLVFELYATTDQAGTEDCTVELSDASGAVLQTSSLQVLLNATQYDFKPQGTVNGTANVGTNNQGPQLGLSLGRGCSACGTLDVVCTIVRRCIWETIKRLLILTAIAAALMLAGYVAWTCWMSRRRRQLYMQPAVMASGPMLLAAPEQLEKKRRGSGALTLVGDVQHKKKAVWLRAGTRLQQQRFEWAADPR